MRALSARQLIIYQDSRHSLTGPATTNGPKPRGYQQEGIGKRLMGAPMTSERWFVENSGRVQETQLG